MEDQGPRIRKPATRIINLSNPKTLFLEASGTAAAVGAGTGSENLKRQPLSPCGENTNTSQLGG